MSVLLADLVATSQEVAATRSRNDKVAAIAAFLTTLAPREIPAAVAFLTGEPRQDRLEVGWAAFGDHLPQPATSSGLTLRDVDDLLDEVSMLSGEGSRAARLAILHDLFAAATAMEQPFLRGLVLRELRQGALAGVVTKAIAAAAQVDEDLVRRAAMLSGNLGAVAGDALTGGADALTAYRLELFRPLQPMLASTSPDPASAMGAGETLIETKLDGARIQVHRDGERVAVFTRNLREVTERLPDIVAAVRALPVQSIVLDGEAIALRGDGRPEPFQVTMGRFGSGREGGPDPGPEDGPDTDLDDDDLHTEVSVPLSGVFFDCIHLDGDDLLERPQRERTAALAATVPEDLRTPSRITADPAEACEFLAAALLAGHEGVMVKALDAPYEAGRRGAAWRKVKPVHTLDLVILAAEWGSGRRSGWLSNLHLGARVPDPEGGPDEFVMLGKTFKGLTDKMLTWQTERLQELEVRRTARTVHVRPELVVEIAIDGVQTSTRYPGGVALRFARVKGFRSDKSPADADTLATVQGIHRGEILPDVPGTTPGAGS